VWSTTMKPGRDFCQPMAWWQAFTSKPSGAAKRLPISTTGFATHGSFDYMSFAWSLFHTAAISLHNNLAVRLFLVRAQAPGTPRCWGPCRLGFRRTFYWDGEVYEMRLPTTRFLTTNLTRPCRSRP